MIWVAIGPSTTELRSSTRKPASGPATASAPFVDVGQHVLGHAAQLRLGIAHGTDAESDAPDPLVAIGAQMVDAFLRRSVGQPRLEPLARVVGAVIEVEELLGIGERRL